MNRRLRTSLATGLLALSIAVPSFASANPAAADDLDANSAPGSVIPNSYIITAAANGLTDTAIPQNVSLAQKAVSEAESIGVKVQHKLDVYGGFSADGVNADQVNKLKAKGYEVRPNRVRYVEGAEPGATKQSLASDERSVFDSNIEKAIAEWSTEKMVVLFLPGSDYQAQQVMRQLNQQDSQWVYAPINRFAKTAVGVMEMMTGKAEGPVLAAVKNGEMVSTFSGNFSAEEVKSWIEEAKKGSAPKPTTAPPTSKPATSKPATSKPATSKPATSKPATSKPATSKPATSKPPTSQPPTSKPATSKPVTTQPTAKVTPPDPQPNAQWNLDQIDSRQAKTDSKFSPFATGKGVNVYVIDSGTYARHSEFKGRIKDGFSAFSNEPAGEDGNGHGTHVASTAAGTVYGVAKEATIYPVRVFDSKGKGSDADIMAGINWVCQNVQYPAVINASWGGWPKNDKEYEEGKAEAQREAKPVIEKGIPFVNASGNDGGDACRHSPSMIPEFIVVGNITKQLNMASSSNHGKCVDISAPGTDIKAAWNNGSTNTISGTSMATPHVTGTVALYLQVNPNARMKEAHDWVIGNASSGLLSSLNGSPNKFLYAGGLK